MNFGRSGRRKRKPLRNRLDGRLRRMSGSKTRRGGPKMLLGWEPRFLLLLLFVACHTHPGDGNEGSIAGSCPCDRRISSGSPPNNLHMERLRKYLKVYQRCSSYVRFQLPLGSVCGGSNDLWVQELMRCFDREQCGRAHTRSMARQGHVPPRSTQVPEPTERILSAMGTPTQTYLPSTQQPTQQPTSPEEAPLLDKKLTHTNATTTYTLDHSLGERPEARGNQKQQEENVGPAAGTSAMVPVLSLLGIVFLLTGALLYVLCKRRRERRLHRPPDLQLPYVRVAANANA
ncbi:C-X-C motif chemokine 16 isoform X3 [Hippopotamus amphibius kiboko]|uniref:C-X-C motif chemokine 16 isoform X3 n=1 Tax=Hippopotamus amphibius kiboko TaxID=575201 RepID=UPI0025941430|nr:C-X-C motif chemokine 16 isoform X3 [Hippopotamus amphibius kiboko]